MSFSFRRLRLIGRREIWCPTFPGLLCITLPLVIAVVWWWNSGESFLSLTHRLPAEVLVVEGWIGLDGIRAAGAEFEQRGYQYVVATGGLTTDRWSKDRWSYAEMARGELIRLGVPEDRIVVAPGKDTESQRTYASAVAVRQALWARGMRPEALNVFTLGPHARRRRLVFAKVEEPGTKVGSISWIPSAYVAMPWWGSSERAKDLLTETAGYLYEALLNSGRGPNSAAEGGSSGGSPDVAQHSEARPR